jgi:cytoskeletal protein CcmA (bactofilin family)
LGTITSSGYSGTAAVATTTVVTDSTANTNFPVVFHNESNGLLDDTGALRYNPSTGELLVPKLTVAGTTTTVDTVTMNAANAIIFEGATADAHETTLTIVDPTADRTINLPNQSGTLPVLAAASNTAVTSTPEELNILAGATVVVGEINALDLGATAVGTAIASKAVILDSNKDYTGIRNLTISGELDAATLDISGDIDVDGTTNLDVVDIDGAVNVAADVTIASTNKIIFNDASQFIHAPSATVLDIAATDEIELTATLIDVVGNQTVSGTLGVTGVLTGTSLDISGDIDVDGTTNLDVVDIDGAVDMATTLAVAGNVDFNGDLT